MATVRIVEPGLEPVSLADVKLYCRETATDRDTIYTLLIQAAREAAENELGRSLLAQTWQLTLDQFPVAIELPHPRVTAVTAVRFMDATTGAWNTLSPACYLLDAKSEPAWLVPADGYDWPPTFQQLNAVTVNYTTGYGDVAAEVPASIRTWICAHVCAWIDNPSAMTDGRYATMPLLRTLLDAHRIPAVP